MGAAAAVELEKPPDASDILGSGSLDFAKTEVIRLRKDLGHLADRYGIEAVVYDASDIVQGDNEQEDFMRCVREVAHIRQCLRLNTQTSKRRLRNCGSGSSTNMRFEETKDYSSGSDSDSD
jgi:hypothetical protein